MISKKGFERRHSSFKTMRSHWTLCKKTKTSNSQVVHYIQLWRQHHTTVYDALLFDVEISWTTHRNCSRWNGCQRKCCCECSRMSQFYSEEERSLWPNNLVIVASPVWCRHLSCWKYEGSHTRCGSLLMWLSFWKNEFLFTIFFVAQAKYSTPQASSVTAKIRTAMWQTWGNSVWEVCCCEKFAKAESE